jgi:hypothetical protein
VLAEGVRARSAVLKGAAIPSGVCSRHAMRCSLYVLQASSYPTIVTRRSAALKSAAIPSESVADVSAGAWLDALPIVSNCHLGDGDVCVCLAVSAWGVPC